MIGIPGRIAELRDAKSLSAIALSQSLGFPRHAIERFESGRQTPNKEQQEKIATFFGVSVAYLRGETNDPTRQDSWMDMAYDSSTFTDPNPSPSAAREAKAAHKAETQAIDDSAFITALLRSQAAQQIIRDVVQEELRKRGL